MADIKNHQTPQFKYKTVAYTKREVVLPVRVVMYVMYMQI